MFGVVLVLFLVVRFGFRVFFVGWLLVGWLVVSQFSLISSEDAQVIEDNVGSQ